MSGLKLILEKNKLTGPNYKDWLRNLTIALTYDKVAYIMNTPPPAPLGLEPTEADKEIHKTWNQDHDLAKCLVLASMSNELQRQHEKMDVQSILLHTKELFGEQSRIARFEVSRKLFHTRMSPNSSVQEHVLKMISFIEELADLGFVLDNELYLDIILQSLPPTFAPFILNFNMNDLKCGLPELLNMLTTAEVTFKKDKTPVMLVGSSSSSSKGKLKGKGKKKALKPKGVIRKPKGKGAKPKGNEKADDKGECFHCHKKGHWKRNCKEYLATLKNKKHGDASASGTEKV